MPLHIMGLISFLLSIVSNAHVIIKENLAKTLRLLQTSSTCLQTARSVRFGEVLVSSSLLRA